MKTLILTALLITLGSFEASAQTIAEVSFTNITGGRTAEQGRQIHLIDAELTEQKTLSIRMRTYKGRNVDFVPELAETLYLNNNVSEALFMKLKKSVKSLDGSIINRTLVPAVCEIAVGFSTDYNFLRVSSHTGLMTTILGPQGCWVAEIITPMHDKDLASAKELQTMLKRTALKFLEL